MKADRLWICAGAALLLAGCDPRLTPSSDLSPREVMALAGVWQGRSSLTYGGKSCPPNYLWTLRVSGGNVDGELVDAETPRAPPTKFSTFVDYDGSLHAFARPGGRDTTIRGAFRRDDFSGNSRSTECTYVVRLRRAPGS